MKTVKNIYDKICDMDNLKLAHKRARRDKSYYKEVKMVNSDEDYYLGLIRSMLKSETYEVSEYTRSIIDDKGKDRELCKLPYFPDRIVQWAIMLQIEPIFEKVFTHFTCASLPNRGAKRVISLMDKYMKDYEGTQYCLKFDISHFYPSINHTVLKTLLRKKFKDERLLKLLDKIIDSTDGEHGIPIGSYLSQYFGNFYLSYFDHWLKEKLKIKYVVRYMDDVVIFGSDKHDLHIKKKQIGIYLKKYLDLDFKDNWQVFPTNSRGVDFVGYRFFHGYRLLRKKILKRMKKRLKIVRRKVKNNFKLTYKDWAATNSYLGWIIHCDSYRLQNKYFAPLKKSLDEYYLDKVKGKGKGK